MPCLPPLHRSTELRRQTRYSPHYTMVVKNGNRLRALPGNRLEALKGDRTGQYSIRINQQWHICFEWPDDQTAPGEERRSGHVHESGTALRFPAHPAALPACCHDDMPSRQLMSGPGHVRLRPDSRRPPACPAAARVLPARRSRLAIKGPPVRITWCRQAGGLRHGLGQTGRSKPGIHQKTPRGVLDSVLKMSYG